MCHRSRHCFPIRPPRCAAIWDQHDAPNLSTSERSCASSAADQACFLVGWARAPRTVAALTGVVAGAPPGACTRVASTTPLPLGAAPATAAPHGAAGAVGASGVHCSSSASGTTVSTPDPSLCTSAASAAASASAGATASAMSLCMTVTAVTQQDHGSVCDPSTSSLLPRELAAPDACLVRVLARSDSGHRARGGDDTWTIGRSRGEVRPACRAPAA